ncbi:anti-sigma factor [uncultured Maritalea sp.]|uniref:anti-sigma factor n=1 Tax=uncultured Maritalea sp. TaxID=757249 RepID=UPI0026370C39|nr:anti-sigma factor [uncultured Maritalea sp.]
MTSPLNERDKMLAAEQAMGVLEGQLREEAAKRYETEIEFRHEVDEWSERLLPLLDQVPSASPSPAVWQNIERAIGTSKTNSSPWWAAIFSANFLAPSFAGALAVLILVVGINYLPLSFAPQPTLTATLNGEAAPQAMLASFDQRSGTLTLTTNMQAADGHEHELWVIAGEGAKPVSMGLVAPKATASITLPDDIRQLLAQGAVLAISVEPTGGSKTGLPTGPVIATGILDFA